MIVWWLLGGVVTVAIGAIVYKEWRSRRSPAASHCVMTKTTDGELLQFLVRPTRRTRREFR